jgi:hypothetical protein
VFLLAPDILAARRSFCQSPVPVQAPVQTLVQAPLHPARAQKALHCKAVEAQKASTTAVACEEGQEDLV